MGILQWTMMNTWGADKENVMYNVASPEECFKFHFGENVKVNFVCESILTHHLYRVF